MTFGFPFNNVQLAQTKSPDGRALFTAYRVDPAIVDVYIDRVVLQLRVADSAQIDPLSIFTRSAERSRRQADPAR